LFLFQVPVVINWRVNLVVLLLPHSYLLPAFFLLLIHDLFGPSVTLVVILVDVQLLIGLLPEPLLSVRGLFLLNGEFL
jgi:hypothetical protein